VLGAQLFDEQLAGVSPVPFLTIPQPLHPCGLCVARTQTAYYQKYQPHTAPLGQPIATRKRSLVDQLRPQCSFSPHSLSLFGRRAGEQRIAALLKTQLPDTDYAKARADCLLRSLSTRRLILILARCPRATGHGPAEDGSQDRAGAHQAHYQARRAQDNHRCGSALLPCLADFVSTQAAAFRGLAARAAPL
jgi:hypothetical protein